MIIEVDCKEIRERMNDQLPGGKQWEVVFYQQIVDSSKGPYIFNHLDPGYPHKITFWLAEKPEYEVGKTYKLSIG